jgi:putative membrane protein
MKGKMKKLLAVVLSGSMAVGLAACGSGSAAQSTSSADTDSASTEASSEENMITSAIDSAVGNTGSTDGVDKEETVYVFTDASGNTKNITVSNWLKNTDKASTLTDSTSLTDITNVKGNETYTEDGDTLTWNADGSDIFYQGSTSEQPPVSESISIVLQL